MNLWDRLKSGIQIVVGGHSQGRQIVKGVTVNNGAMRPKQGEEWLHGYNTMPWLAAGARKIASGVASLEWGITRTMDASGMTVKRADIQKGSLEYRRKALAALEEEGKAEAVFDHPFLSLWKNPCPALPGGAARKLAQVYYEVVGEVFFVVDRGPRDAWIKSDFTGRPLPTALWPVPPYWVKRVPTPDNPTFEIRHVGLQMNDIPMSEVLWLKDPDPMNPYARGVGIYGSLKDELETDENAASMMSYSFYNRNRPDVLITLPGASDEELTKFRNEWIANLQGVQNTLKSHFINDDAKVEQIGYDFREMQVVELRRHTRDTIRQVPGIPPEMLGIQDQSNRSTIEAAEYIFSKHLIEPRAEIWREFLGTQLLIEYDPRAVLDYVSPTEADKNFALEAMGASPEVFRVNEKRKLAGQPALTEAEGGRMFYVNGAFVPSLLTAPPPAGMPGGPPGAPGTGGGLPNPGFDGGINVPGAPQMHLHVPGAPGSAESGQPAGSPPPQPPGMGLMVPGLPKGVTKGAPAFSASRFRREAPAAAARVPVDVARAIARWSSATGHTVPVSKALDVTPIPISKDRKLEFLRRSIAYMNGTTTKGWDRMFGRWSAADSEMLDRMIGLKGWDDPDPGTIVPAPGSVTKGDLPGHEFRGNQYTSGQGGGGEDRGASSLKEGDEIITTSPSGESISARVTITDSPHSSGKPALQLRVEGRGLPMIVTQEHLDKVGFARAGAAGLIGKLDQDEHAAFIQARDKSTRSGFLSPLTHDDMMSRDVYMNRDGTVGFTLTKGDKDFGNLFNTSGTKGAGREAIVQGIKLGARTLDCFDGFLPGLYSKYGFVETARLKFDPEQAPKGWKDDPDLSKRPDVVFMAYNGGDRETIEQRVGKFPPKTEAPRVKTYDDAKASQERQLRAQSRRAKGVLKHLEGQHDQQSHASGGSERTTVPGKFANAGKVSVRFGAGPYDTTNFHATEAEAHQEADRILTDRAEGARRSTARSEAISRLLSKDGSADDLPALADAVGGKNPSTGAVARFIRSHYGSKLNDADKAARRIPSFVDSAGTTRHPVADVATYLREHGHSIPVKKGDFEGHPFRGNQWTDGQGGGDEGGSGGTKSIEAEETTKVADPFRPYVDNDDDGDGVTDAARVGVPARTVPPPPSVPRLPNLTPQERAAESAFADAYEKDPDGMAEKLLEGVRADPPPTFESDAAKNLFGAWKGEGLSPEDRAQVRSTLNTALHQTANAVTKRAFLKHLDEMSDADKAKGVLVTVGGCGAGKGFALKTLSAQGYSDFNKKLYGAVWDSAGDQNATENPWILDEAEKRGIKVTYAYISSDPEMAWADPQRGVVQRAGDPKDGRMVDASVFADSYVVGAKNHASFSERNKDRARFVYVRNGSSIEKLDGVPDSDLKRDRKVLREFAVKTIERQKKLQPRIRRGALLGARIWK